MRKEERILLICSRVDMQDGDIRALHELSYSELDWEYLINIACYHRVFPLLYKNLKRHIPNDLPDSAFRQLKDICMRNGVRNLFLVSTLMSVLKLLKKHGIQALPFKGPALTENIYGDIGLRSFGDLDLLIPRTDLRKAVFVLQEQGFRLDLNLEPEQYEKLVDKGHHAVLIKGGAVVELHWELTGRYFSRKVDIEAVNSRVEEVAVAGQQVNTFGSEDLLLYLCIHGCRHHWIQLDAVCCVAELVKKKSDLDWDLVWQLARKLGALKMVLLGLLLAKNLSGLVLPVKVEKMLRQYPKLNSIACCIGQKIFLSSELSQMQMSYREYVLFHYAIMDKYSDWLRYCVKPLLNTTHSDWLWVRLPASLSFLYYILRPLRLVSKYSNKIFR